MVARSGGGAKRKASVTNRMATQTQKTQGVRKRQVSNAKRRLTNTSQKQSVAKRQATRKAVGNAKRTAGTGPKRTAGTANLPNRKPAGQSSRLRKR